MLDKSTREFVSTTKELQEAVDAASSRRFVALQNAARLAPDEAWEPTAAPLDLVDIEAVAGGELRLDQIDIVLQSVLKTLPPREQKVLTARYGLDGGPTRTMKEVGQMFNVPEERIRGILAKAFRKLRQPLLSRKLLHASGEVR